jgi:hypothetical protein
VFLLVMLTLGALASRLVFRTLNLQSDGVYFEEHFPANCTFVIIFSLHSVRALSALQDASVISGESTQ